MCMWMEAFIMTLTWTSAQIVNRPWPYRSTLEIPCLNATFYTVIFHRKCGPFWCYSTGIRSFSPRPVSIHNIGVKWGMYRNHLHIVIVVNLSSAHLPVCQAWSLCVCVVSVGLGETLMNTLWLFLLFPTKKYNFKVALISGTSEG